MKFKFFRSANKNKDEKKEVFFEAIDQSTDAALPEIYRGVQTYESESDRFCPFDEDYFAGENYDIKRKRIIIPPPKTPPSFFMGILCGAILILIASGTVTFLSLFSKFGGIYQSVSIPNLTSLSESDAIKALTENYDCFEYTVEYKENPNTSAGTVISQLPKPNTLRKLYGINGKINVKLTVNKKSEPLTLPDLVGQNARDVALELKNAGINVTIKGSYSDKVKLGRIISSSHESGSQIYKNDTVILTESLGKPISYVSTPSLIGMSESSAITLLRSQKLILSNVTYESSALPLGTVIAQSIESGSTVREGSKISLSVSGGASAPLQETRKETP